MEGYRSHGLYVPHAATGATIYRIRGSLGPQKSPCTLQVGSRVEAVSAWNASNRSFGVDPQAPNAGVLGDYLASLIPVLPYFA